MPTAILVYRYGLLSPTAGADAVADAIRLAHRYRNDLVAIERGKRTAMRGLYRELGLDELEAAVAAAEAEVEASIKALSAERACGRSKKATSEVAKVRLAAAKALKKEALTAFITARRQLDGDRATALAIPSTGDAQFDAYLVARRAYDACVSGPNSGERGELRDALLDAATAIHDAGRTGHPVANVARVDAIQLRAAAMRRSARSICGIDQGTYALVEAAMDTSVKSLPLYDGAEPNDPRFVRWSGEGQVGLQLNGGMDPAVLFDPNSTKLRITRLPDPPHITGRRSGQRAILSMRVGGAHGTIVSWPMIMHRPLPEGAVVKWATVSRRVDGPTTRWSVELTVQVDAATRARPTHTLEKAVSVDVGWRQMGARIRVASWYGTDGATGELYLDEKTISAMRYPGTLRSIRDESFNAARAGLMDWIRGGGAIPEWMLKATSHIGQWRSAARLASVARRWLAEQAPDAVASFRAKYKAAIASGVRPLQGFEAGWEALAAWEAHDLHLWQWESDQRRKSLGRRREIYRVFAATMAKRYGTCVVEDFDKRAVAKRPPVESETAENETARSNRQLVATSELVGALTNAFRRENTCKVDPAWSTHECEACHAMVDFDAAENIHAACTNCGVVFDQDANAARVLMQRWMAGTDRERGSDRAGTGAARNGEKENDAAEVGGSKWTRAKARKSARMAEQVDRSQAAP